VNGIRSRRRLGVFLALAAVPFAAQTATAHPLGNFTINHYSGIRVEPSAVVIDHVTDYAEVPTFSERRAMDGDADGAVSAAEAAAFESATCQSLGTQLSLSVDAQRVPLTNTHSGLSFPMGQGSLTMRLVCIYQATVETATTAGTRFFFSDGSYPERRGWREIVVEGDRATVVDSDALPRSTSARLTTYPTDQLTIPLGQSSASFSIVPGGPPLDPLTFTDAEPIGAHVPKTEGAAPAPAAVPAGVTELGAEVTSLFQASDLTPPVVLLGLLVAAGLGALHALSPGHGKTVMAAYLVGSRGKFRHAIGLGLTVTVSHTLGVLVLGALTVSAAWIIPPERLYPILSIVSGAIVVVIGGYLLWSRFRGLRQQRTLSHDHDLEGGDVAAAREHEHARPPGWHEHDGVGHTHLPVEGMGGRGLFALGLSGGMIPSVSALLVLIGSISIGRPIYGVVLTIAFGVGMAAVLVGLGLTLVYARKLVSRLPQISLLQLDRRLPIVTAAIVLAAGLLITGQGLVALG
jgi:ABC-type nickel/cobalt efflux system permease component RcnA